MPIVVQCTNCQAKMKAPDGSEGRKAKCPRCGTLVTILALGLGDDAPAPPVESGDDAGHVTSVPKKSSPGAPPTPKKAQKSDFDFVDDDEPEQDEPLEEEDERPRKKSSSYSSSRKPARSSRDDDDDDDRPSRRSRRDDDDDYDDDDDRPRKKRRKRRSSSSSGGDSGMDGLFVNDGTTVGLCVVAFCCCWPITLILGIIGLVACSDPNAKRNALIVTIVSGVKAVIEVLYVMANGIG